MAFCRAQNCPDRLCQCGDTARYANLSCTAKCRPTLSLHITGTRQPLLTLRCTLESSTPGERIRVLEQCYGSASLASYRPSNTAVSAQPRYPETTHVLMFIRYPQASRLQGCHQSHILYSCMASLENFVCNCRTACWAWLGKPWGCGWCAIHCQSRPCGMQLLRMRTLP